VDHSIVDREYIVSVRLRETGPEPATSNSRARSAPAAFGKTAVAAWLIAKHAVNTMVLVHRQQLLDQ